MDPSLEWRTLETQHFRIHFSPGLEITARLAARYAESGYALLSTELKPPRGTIDLVVADNRDFANGYATPFPTNRIVVYAVPPVNVPMLRNTENWLENVVFHELVHVFHLDRAGGLWRAAQWVFGRSPSLMPNNYAPAWIKEGLAVYYESRLTGEGRLGSGEQHMLIRAAAESDAFPGIGSFSLTTSREPEGQTAYVYGSRLLQFLADRGGPEHMDEFIGSMSATIVPFLYSHSAKKAFGISLGRAWSLYRDSVSSVYDRGVAPFPGWARLTPEGRTAWYPRWAGDDSLIFVRDSGREMPGLYSLTLDGDAHRIARRNSLAVNAVAPDGSVVFAQPEYTDPYTIRFDLYRRDVDGHETRLTYGARLTSPDVRADGEIVAVQASNGTTSLVRVSADGSRVAPITDALPQNTWADPRWSPDGSTVVAVRRSEDGSSEIALFRDAQARLSVLGSTALLAGPIWVSDSRLLFHRDNGRSQIVAMDINGAGAGAERIVSGASTGVLQPALSPDGSRIAAVEYRADGYHVGVADAALDAVAPDRLPAIQLGGGSTVARPAPLPQSPEYFDTLTAQPYAAGRFLIPRYWVPLASESETGGVLVGGYTSAYDVVDRHTLAAQLLVNTQDSAVEGYALYSYSGFGMPVISLGLERSLDYSPVFGGQPRQQVGYVKELAHIASVSLQVRRPRFRSAALLSVGAEYERDTYSTDPKDLIFNLANFGGEPREFYGLNGSASWSNARRPSLSISPEDGTTISTLVQARWRRGASSTPSTTATASLRLFKSLDLPGFAHHVIAARVSGGYSNALATKRFGVGGRSGSKYEIFPGYSIGDASRLFPVRGFQSSAAVGTRAMAASVEYRLPLFMPSYGIGLFPLFFDRVSLSVFGDMGSAWCPPSHGLLSICDDVPLTYAAGRLSSAGVELNLDAAVQYDIPYRLRVGFARVLSKPHALVAKKSELYFTLGFPF